MWRSCRCCRSPYVGSTRGSQRTEAFSGIVFVVAIIAGIWQGIGNDKKKQAMRAHVAQGSGFRATQELMADTGDTGILLDEARKEICLIGYNQGRVRKRLFPYADILSAEVIEDGEAITQSIRTSQVGSALIGGVLLGGIGAVVGGLSGKRRTRTKVKRVDFQVVVNDAAAPIHTIALMSVEGWPVD